MLRFTQTYSIIICCVLAWTTAAYSIKTKTHGRVVENTADTPYTIVITTLSGKKISQSTIKKDTFSFARSLYYDLTADEDSK